VNAAVLKALRRKLRLQHYHAQFFHELRVEGRSSITWNFTRYNASSDRGWVTFEAGLNSDGTYAVRCFGPQADLAIKRINTALAREAVPDGCHTVRKNSRRIRGVARKRRLLAKRKKLLAKRAAGLVAAKPKRRRVPTPAPLSLKRNEVLVPQFRKSRVFWREAVAMTMHAFEVRGNWKRSAREIVVRELYDSLERNGYRFAQYKRRGFSLRFDMAGAYCGDITAVTVSCTKDNTHPAYRRLRKQLHLTLHGLNPKEQRRRTAVLWDNSQRIAA
jgi:hypothetical protein